MDILGEIIAAKRIRIRGEMRDLPWALLEAEPLWAEPRRSLAAGLRREAGPIRFLTEIKRASPSAGAIALDADAVHVARAYRDAGSSGLSLVTEEEYFRGRPLELPSLRDTGLPILMKDFFVETWQVARARSLGADAILLILALDDLPLLRELAAAARELGLDVLAEVHSEAECEAAARLGVPLIGVNNRDLSTFAVDLKASERLIHYIPPDVVRLSESGIRTRADVLCLEAAGFDALLVGESLMRAREPGMALRELSGSAGEGRA